MNCKNCDSWCDMVQPVFVKLAKFIIWASTEGDSITSQMERYFSILLSHIGLFCLCSCFYFLFIITLVSEVFKRPSEWDSRQLCRFIIGLALKRHCMCFALKLRVDYVKTSFRRCFGMEYTWSVFRNLTGDYFSTDVFWKLWLFFDAIH